MKMFAFGQGLMAGAARQGQGRTVSLSLRCETQSFSCHSAQRSDQTGTSELESPGGPKLGGRLQPEHRHDHFSIRLGGGGRSCHGRGKSPVATLLNLKSSCQVWSLLLTMPGSQLVSGQFGSTVQGSS